MVNNIIINLKYLLLKQITAVILHHVKNLWIIYMNNLLVTIFYSFLKAFRDSFCFTSSETSCPTLGNFSELNPIKSLWNLVKHGLIKHDCATVERLISALMQMWYHDHELPSMCKKLQSCSWYFEMVQQIFLSSQVKRRVIISSKLVYKICLTSCRTT